LCHQIPFVSNTMLFKREREDSEGIHLEDIAKKVSTISYHAIDFLIPFVKMMAFGCLCSAVDSLVHKMFHSLSLFLQCVCLFVMLWMTLSTPPAAPQSTQVASMSNYEEVSDTFTQDMWIWWTPLPFSLSSQVRNTLLLKR
jgi:hypothetical protein